MELITLTQENLESEHICCAISNNKDCQVLSKKEWLKERLDEGLMFVKCNVRGKCFIEYIPAEAAWAPVEADGYMYIDCLWVSGQFKGHGYSNLLLEEMCIRDRDMVLLSSVSEGQPFVLLEAMAAGRPVIATDVGSCRELIEGNLDTFGSAGLVVPVMNPDQMARAILKLGQDAGLRKRMARVGRERVNAYYREEDFLSAYEKLYQEVNVIGRSRV